jgi:hypothetical protein
VLRHKGANVALWNLEGSAVAEAGGKVSINGEPLLFFHFHRLKQLQPWLFRTDAASYGVRLDATVQRLIYAPHLHCWIEMTRFAHSPAASPYAASHPLGRVARWARDVLRGARQAVSGSGDYLTVWPWPSR